MDSFERQLRPQHHNNDLNMCGAGLDKVAQIGEIRRINVSSKCPTVINSACMQEGGQSLQRDRKGGGDVLTLGCEEQFSVHLCPTARGTASRGCLCFPQYDRIHSYCS